MKILLTGGKSAVALKLSKAFTNDQVVLADYGDVPVFASKDYAFISIGVKNEDVLAHNLLNVCLNENVDAVLPIHSFEVEALAKAEVLFNEFNITLLLPNAFELANYFKTVEISKGEHWGVFNKGDLIFSTQVNEEIVELGKNKNLNGAFYIKNNKDIILLTI